MKRIKTIFCDIDGTLIVNNGCGIDKQLDPTLTLLPGVKDIFDDWERKDYKIILTTGRKECLRVETEKQLKSLGLFWDQLIMNISGGERVLINDKKPNNDLTAFAINVDRNVGLKDVTTLI
jgi:hydroxymethylpyrimidine pyrophosphatase-like HAD family hydrolase